MIEFIIVTQEDTERKIILPLEKIMSIVETLDGKAFIEMALNTVSDSIGICTKENINDIIDVLKNKILNMGENENV